MVLYALATSDGALQAAKALDVMLALVLPLQALAPGYTVFCPRVVIV